MDGMRLFVALRPPVEALTELDAAVSALRTGSSLRWVPPDQWHVTVAFLGAVEADAVPELTTRLARAAHRHPSLRLRLGGGGAFPSGRRGGVLWVGVDGDTTALRPLVWSVRAAARRSGIPVDEGRFRPHITLARRRPPGDLRDPVGALASFAGTPFAADRIELVESFLGGGPDSGARHEVRASWPLAAA